MGFSDWWYYTGAITKTLVLIGMTALALLTLTLLAPHVSFLKPIAQRLGLVQTQTIYVPVNHTVYVNRTIYVNQTVVRYINQTVPIYINRTVYVPVGSNMSYFESYAGYCSGRLVILPNNTAWIVWFWLAPKTYFESIPQVYRWYFKTYPPVYYNTTTHYAQFDPAILAAYFMSPQGVNLFGWYGTCYVNNVTINNQYYILVCGDTVGYGPFMLNPLESGGSLSGGLHIAWNGSAAYEVIPMNIGRVFITNNFIVVGNFTYVYMPIPVENATYTGVMFLGYPVGSQIMQYAITPGPICDLIVTFATNATAALWLPVTTNQTLVNYWRESVIPVYGWYNQYDDLMGYFVWHYPS
jgi:hypothetical protein